MAALDDSVAREPLDERGRVAARDRALQLDLLAGPGHDVARARVADPLDGDRGRTL